MKKKLICKSCGYIYEPEIIDIDGAPGVYDKLPDDWVCPGCGADLSQMAEVEEKQSAITEK